MRRTQKSLIAMAAGMCLAGTVMAQSTTGDVTGVAPAGSTVVIKSTSGGLTREVKVTGAGEFRIQSLPAGEYEMTGGGKTVRVRVLAGQTSDADLSPLATVTVVGRAKSIDTSSTETRTTFTAEQLDKLPVGRNVTSVSLLTPGTNSSSGYFGPASFGGASAAENSYYVNGFNVTNMYDILSFAEVPFQAIGQLDVQTGGYGARYGLSTGGVTSVNIKKGTNEFKGGASYTLNPNAFKSSIQPVALSNGTIFREYNDNSNSSHNASAWLGGPILKDKLFFFFLVSQSQTDATTWGARGTGYSTSSTLSYTSTSTTGYDYSSKNPYAVLKLDWNINDSNILEYTGFHNKSKQQYNNYNATYNGTTLGASIVRGAYTGKENLENGGDTHILKWTSYLTDNLTLAVQYGRMKNTNSDWTTNPNGVENKYSGNIGERPSCPYVYDYAVGAVTGCSTLSSANIYGGFNQRDAGRVDLEWQLGSHKLAAGYNADKWKSKQGTVQNVIYLGSEATLNGDDTTWNTANGSQKLFEEIVFATGSTVKIDQKSFYLEDNWNVTKNFMLYGGIRNDSFENKNGAGKLFVKQDNIWQPRLGFTLDLIGGGNSKLYGSLGRYSLPIAANVALRSASASYYTDNLYTYDGTTDPVTKVPTNRSVYHDKNGATYLYVNNGEDGSTPDAAAVADKSLKPYTQDELILGYQQQLKSDNAWLDGWTLGIKGTYRTVRNAIDDTCDSRAIYNAGIKAGLNLSNWDSQWAVPGGIPGCYIYNPGRDLHLTIDVDQNGTPDNLTVPASELGPKAKRLYKSLTLSAEKRAPTWYLNASYTWSKLTGNLEGLVKSTNGQEDTGTTSDFDFKEIMIGADGKLFNDHTHSIKVYGSYKASSEWELGMNMALESGSPISCLGGGQGSFGTQYGYTGVFHTCGTGASLTDRTDDPVSPVGAAGRTPWTFAFSPSITFTPSQAKGLSLQVTVFNLFNNIKATQAYETNVSYSGATVRRYLNYGQGKYFTDPRSVQLKAQYDF